jgi:hypothetical protein
MGGKVGFPCADTAGQTDFQHITANRR